MSKIFTDIILDRYKHKLIYSFFFLVSWFMPESGLFFVLLRLEVWEDFTFKD